MEPHHPIMNKLWNLGGQTKINKERYKPAELMEHFVKTVIPLAVTNKVTNEPPLEIPGLPTQLVKVTLGTKSDDCIALNTSEAKEDEDFRIAEMRKREKLEDSGCGDELQ